jgi:hypothetical protein
MSKAEKSESHTRRGYEWSGVSPRDGWLSLPAPPGEATLLRRPGNGLVKQGITVAGLVKVGWK